MSKTVLYALSFLIWPRAWDYFGTLETVLILLIFCLNYIYICCVFMHTLLSTQWFSWMLRWNLCGKSTTGCTQIFLYRPNVRNLLHLFAIVATTLKVLKLKPSLPYLKERKHVNTFSFHCFYSKDFIRWEKLSSD